MVKTALFHSLWLSPTSTKWDLKAELIITTLRSIMSTATFSISKQQEFGFRDPGVKGPMWISRVTLPSPSDDDLRQLLLGVIEEMKSDGETYTKPEMKPVKAEWTGYRKGVPNNAPEPDISEEAKFGNLQDATSNNLTILYFHGGAHYLMSPASHRGTTSKLAKMTGGRVLSVEYRLAPQNPFPAAILDSLVVYLNLLYPPPGSYHTAVAPSNIVFAGDSAGGNICFSLAQFLLHCHRSNPSPTVKFNGQTVALPLPGGIASNSPWLDVTRCLPSLTSNARYDYLPPPEIATSSLSTSSEPAPDPINAFVCPAWPATPPRADLYTDGSAMCHPLISPLAAPTRDWRGCPPVFICAGEEMLADEIRVVTRRLAKAGVCVRWEGFEAMPHCFAMVLDGSVVGERCFKGWADWMVRLVEGGEMGSGAVWIRAKTGVEEVVRFEDLTDLEDEEVKRLMDDTRDERCRVFEEVLKGRAAKTTGN